MASIFTGLFLFSLLLVVSQSFVPFKTRTVHVDRISFLEVTRSSGSSPAAFTVPSSPQQQQQHHHHQWGQQQQQVVLNRNERKWLMRFDQLKDFIHEHGHCHPDPDDESTRALAVWTKNQRMHYKYIRQGRKTSLTARRLHMLNSIGFVWSIKESKWIQMYYELKEYHARYGHSDVPSLSSQSLNLEHQKLSRWVTQQRQKYKQAMEDGYDSNCQALSKQQIQVLNDLDFVWYPRDDLWWKRYEELQLYHEEHGHCRVPQRYSLNPDLGKWCHHLRRACKEYVLSVMIEGRVEGVTVTGLSQDRIQALRNIDFCWLPDAKIYTPPPENVLTSWYSYRSQD